MAEVLDGDYETVEEAARAALSAALEIIYKRGRYTVVGQVVTKDNSGDKIALGLYATEKQALTDALSLSFSTQTNERHLAWVLPVWNGTPFSYYQERKRRLKQEELSNTSYLQRELARRVQWLEDHPDDPVPEEWGVIPFASETTECSTCNGTGRVRQKEAA